MNYINSGNVKIQNAQTFLENNIKTKKTTNKQEPKTKSKITS